MQGRSEGLCLYVRHSSDCKFHPSQRHRDQSRRCNCVKYIAGTAPDGTRVRQSTGTASWEKAQKVLSRRIAEHDPVNRPLFNAGLASAVPMERQTVKEAISQFLEMKRGEKCRRHDALRRPVRARVPSLVRPARHCVCRKSRAISVLSLVSLCRGVPLPLSLEAEVAS